MQFWYNLPMVWDPEQSEKHAYVKRWKASNLATKLMDYIHDRTEALIRGDGMRFKRSTRRALKIRWKVEKLKRSAERDEKISRFPPN
jgi:hypothetical protein